MHGSMQLAVRNPNIYSMFITNYFSWQNLEKTAKIEFLEKPAFSEKSAYSSFTKFAIGFKDFFS